MRQLHHFFVPTSPSLRPLPCALLPLLRRRRTFSHHHRCPQGGPVPGTLSLDPRAGQPRSSPRAQDGSRRLDHGGAAARQHVRAPCTRRVSRAADDEAHARRAAGGTRGVSASLPRLPRCCRCHGASFFPRRRLSSFSSYLTRRSLAPAAHRLHTLRPRPRGVAPPARALEPARLGQRRHHVLPLRRQVAVASRRRSLEREREQGPDRVAAGPPPRCIAQPYFSRQLESPSSRTCARQLSYARGGLAIRSFGSVAAS